MQLQSNTCIYTMTRWNITRCAIDINSVYTAILEALNVLVVSIRCSSKNKRIVMDSLHRYIQRATVCIFKLSGLDKRSRSIEQPAQRNKLWSNMWVTIRRART